MQWGVCTPLHQKKEQLMNNTTASPSSIPDPVAVPGKSEISRCPYRYPNGKRCRLPGLPAHSGFCLGHWRTIATITAPVAAQSDSEDLSADLLPELSEFSSGTDIRQFLARLLILLTKGRISPRRAAVLAYITNQLLHSHRAIDRELQADNDSDPRIIIDIPRPKRDWPEGSERACYERMSSHSVPNNGETPTSTNTKESA